MKFSGGTGDLVAGVCVFGQIPRQAKLKSRMSAQILLQGRLLSTEDFLLATPADRDNRAFEARSTWLVLIGEAVPRALLAELQLPPLMLGSSGGDRFVVILPDQARAEAAGEFLGRVSQALSDISSGKLSLVWSATENLGDWTIVRKRLQDGMRKGTRPRAAQPGYFDAFHAQGAGADRIPRDLRDVPAIGWSFDFPALIAANSNEGGVCRWDVGTDAAISITRHGARNGEAFAATKELARRAQGQRLWGVLRGEIDDYGTRMRRLQSVEEHVHLSMLYKQFLAGEIQLLCSQGEYFQRVTVLHSGASNFAIYGSWDALAGFARELERVFSRFAQENLKDLPGAEAKTITMALTIAEPGAPLARVYEDCGRDLEIARASDKDCLHILGRVLEWKQLNEAAELKEALVHLNEEFRGGRQFLAQLRNLYKKVESPDNTDEERLMSRALRFQRRFARVASRREREFQKLRSHLMKEMAGRNVRGRLKLRPEGLIALEWARLAED
jgi:CRISPR-associated protein Csm1